MSNVVCTSLTYEMVTYYIVETDAGKRIVICVFSSR